MESIPLRLERRPRRWGVILTALSLSALLAFGIIRSIPPLISTDAYSVQYSVRGQAYTDGEVLCPVLMGHLLYIRLPGLTGTFYGWFLVDLQRGIVSRPHGPYSFHGFDYIHSDQAFGLRLSDPKIEDHWSVTFQPGVVAFSNASIHVAVTNRNANSSPGLIMNP